MIDYLNKSTLFFIFLLNVGSLSLFSQTCLNAGIFFDSQQSIDNFATNYPDCTHILGNVTIEIPSSPEAISLTGLAQILQIGGSLSIWANCESYEGLHNLDTIKRDLILNSTNGNTGTTAFSNLKHLGGSLELSQINDFQGFSEIDSVFGKIMIAFGNNKNLQGLNNLRYVKDYIWISNSDSLQSLSGLENLRVVEEGFYLFGTPACPLNSLAPLSNLEKVGGRFAIESLPNLKDLTGLVKLETLGSFSTFSSHFETLDGLQGITEIALIKINSSPHLKSLSGLENITTAGEITISGCDSILNLTGLNGLQKVDDLLVYGNDNLINLEGLENLETISNNLRIHRNPLFESFEGLELKEKSGSIWLNDLPALKNFSNFCCLNQIDGILSITESGITSLTGLENIESLGAIYFAFNEDLQTLDGLENLEKIKSLYLIGNTTLSNIDALTRVNADNFTISVNASINISENPALSICNIEPICNALSKPDLVAIVENNLTFCDSRETILSQCFVNTSNKNFDQNMISVYPNPFTQNIQVESNLTQSIFLINSIGEVINSYEIEQTTMELKMDHISPGVYFLQTENGQMMKLIKQ